MTDMQMTGRGTSDPKPIWQKAQELASSVKKPDKLSGADIGLWADLGESAKGLVAMLKDPVKQGQYDSIRQLITDWEDHHEDSLETIRDGDQASTLMSLMVLIGYIEEIKSAVGD